MGCEPESVRGRSNANRAFRRRPSLAWCCHGVTVGRAVANRGGNSARVAEHEKGSEAGAADTDQLMTFQIGSECSYICSETFKFFVAK